MQQGNRYNVVGSTQEAWSYTGSFLQTCSTNGYVLTNTEQGAIVWYLKVLSAMRRSAQATPAFPILITNDNHKGTPSTLQLGKRCVSLIPVKSVIYL